MGPEGSILNSQELSTCSYPEPDQSSPHHSIPPLQSPSQYYPPTYVLVLLAVFFLPAFPPIHDSLLPHSGYMTRPAHPPRFVILKPILHVKEINILRKELINHETLINADKSELQCEKDMEFKKQIRVRQLFSRHSTSNASV
jgi:hypothetical protein